MTKNPHAQTAIPAELFAAISGRIGRPTGQPERVAISSNFVVSLDGKVALDQRSGHMGGPADKEVFRLLRATSDAILVGAATAAAENYRPVELDDWAVDERVQNGRPAVPALVLVTNSGKVPPIPVNPRTGEPPIVITPRSQAAEVSRQHPDYGLWTTESDTLTARDIRREFEKHAITSVLCEGGPRLMAELLVGECIDEMNFTIAPRIIGNDQATLVPRHAEVSTERWTLKYAVAHEGDIYVRYERGLNGRTNQL